MSYGQNIIPNFRKLLHVLFVLCFPSPRRIAHILMSAGTWRPESEDISDICPFQLRCRGGSWCAGLGLLHHPAAAVNIGLSHFQYCYTCKRSISLQTETRRLQVRWGKGLDSIHPSSRLLSTLFPKKILWATRFQKMSSPTRSWKELVYSSDCPLWTTSFILMSQKYAAWF